VEAEGRNDERAEFSGNRGEETGDEDLKFERVECGLTGCFGELVERLGSDGGGLSDGEQVEDKHVGNDQLVEGGKIKEEPGEGF
jgi:hypothetical protein